MADEELKETSELTKQQKKNRKKREAQKAKKKNATQDKTSSHSMENQHASNDTNHQKGLQMSLDPNDDGDNFEIELSWCIEQLRLGLVTQKPPPEQAKETERVIRQLSARKAPKAKKRQIMRSVFGDYRKKMEVDAKQFLQDNEIKKGSAHKASHAYISSSSSVEGKGLFVKKKSADTTGDNKVENGLNFSKSQNAFQFNFPKPSP